MCWFETIKIEYIFVVTPPTVHNLGSKENYLKNKIQRLCLIASTIIGTAQQRAHRSNTRQLEVNFLRSWAVVFPEITNKLSL